MKKQCEQWVLQMAKSDFIIAPCHRVIGAGGALVGFAGGLDKKDILLRLEQK